MRLALTGASGQLGLALREAFGQEDTDLLALSRRELDVTAPDATARLEVLRPELILHAAALTDVDACEREPERAYLVNEQGARQVALAAARLEAPIVYFSTDYVFPGDREAPYGEADQPRPVNVYGRSKLAGERVVAELVENAFIVRTAWLYGDGPRNFVGRMLEFGQARRPFPVVDNEVGSPTYTRDCAQAVKALVERGPPGLYHLVNEGQASRFELARAVLDLAGLDPDLVQPSQHHPRPAQRPRRVVLSNQAARALGVTLRPWRDALQARLTASK